MCSKPPYFLMARRSLVAPQARKGDRESLAN